MRKILSHPYTIPLILFLFFTGLYFTSTVGVMNSLDGSQYALTQALYEKQTISMDDFMKWTYWTDYSMYKGKYFSDRNPGVSFVSVPFYFLYYSPFSSLFPSTVFLETSRNEI